MKDFKKLTVWQKGMDLADLIYDIAEAFPKGRGYKLADQLERAAVSVPSNIAEGSSRRSEKEKYRFLEIALGSSFEMETQLLILKRRRWASDIDTKEAMALVEEVQKMIQAFMARMKV